MKTSPRSKAPASKLKLYYIQAYGASFAKASLWQAVCECLLSDADCESESTARRICS